MTSLDWHRVKKIEIFLGGLRIDLWTKDTGTGWWSHDPEPCNEFDSINDGGEGGI